MLDGIGAPVQSEQPAKRWMANGDGAQRRHTADKADKASKISKSSARDDAWNEAFWAAIEQCRTQTNDYRATGAPEAAVHFFVISQMRTVLDTHARQEQRRLAKSLTHRQREVLTLVSRNLPTRLIAEQLCISASTVERHINDACKRLGVSGRIVAARFAQEMGLIPREDQPLKNT